MRAKIPHIVQYQGSKRILAQQILQYMPHSFNRLIEPFSGMAAISVAAAHRKDVNKFLINDINAPLINMLSEAIEAPQRLILNYTKLWTEQFSFEGGHIQHFYAVRERFNGGDTSPENMLYILARCVKGAVRYGKDGKFNQSPDKRRHGTNPQNIKANVGAVSSLLKGQCVFNSCDYKEIFAMAKHGDIVYMDPPYQGVTNVRDNRYFSGVPFDDFVDAIDMLNKKGVDYLISYDGECGGREYGKELPSELGCKKILLNAGISSQSTLLGKKEITFEALYISKNLRCYIERVSYEKQSLLMKNVV